jgi:hypothetical protein
LTKQSLFHSFIVDAAIVFALRILRAQQLRGGS